MSPTPHRLPPPRSHRCSGALSPDAKNCRVSRAVRNNHSPEPSLPQMHATLHLAAFWASLRRPPRALIIPTSLHRPRAPPATSAIGSCVATYVSRETPGSSRHPTSGSTLTPGWVPCHGHTGYAALQGAHPQHSCTEKRHASTHHSTESAEAPRGSDARTESKGRAGHLEIGLRESLSTEAEAAFRTEERSRLQAGRPECHVSRETQRWEPTEPLLAERGSFRRVPLRPVPRRARSTGGTS